MRKWLETNTDYSKAKKSCHRIESNSLASGLLLFHHKPTKPSFFQKYLFFFKYLLLIISFTVLNEVLFFLSGPQFEENPMPSVKGRRSPVHIAQYTGKWRSRKDERKGGGVGGWRWRWGGG